MHADPHIEIAATLKDIERIRKLLARLKLGRIGSSEHRDLLKATALSWFRSRRPTIEAMLSPEALSAIDRPHRIILDAAERYSSKTTFVSAANNAKSALLAARGAILITTPTIPTGDLIPDFNPLVADPIMRGILIRRWEECIRCLQSKASLAATVMMGGLLEALLVARSNQMADKSRLFQAKATPVDAKTKKPLELRQWTLAPYIDVGHEIGWISRSGKDVAAVLRDYRNYIHPEKEKAHGIALTLDDALMLWEITKSLSRELLSFKGAM